MRLIKIISRKIENCIWLFLGFYLILFLVLGYIWLTLLSIFLSCDITSILKIPEVLAVIVVALPTLLIWAVDINNKNIENKSENFNMYFDIQNSLEEKYRKLKDEVKEFLQNEDLKEDIRLNLNQLDKIEKFIDDLEYFKKETKINSSFYQIDLFYFFKEINVFNNNIENSDVDKKIGKIKGRIMKYTLANCLEDSLMEKVYLLTEEGTFSYIDFRNLGDLTKFAFEGNPTFSFRYCKIDLNNFSGFIAENIKLTAEECRFYKGDKEVTSYISKKELQESFNIIVLDSDFTAKNISSYQRLNENKEKNTNRTFRFVDNRSSIGISNEMYYVPKGMSKKNSSNWKKFKTELANQIEDELNIENISVRYSKDYSYKDELNGNVKWQSWHSIDLPVLDIENELIIDNIDNIQSGYAFVTEKDKEFHILFFVDNDFKELLKEKIEKNAYTIYKNAQQKDYVKFNFYFAELVKEIAVQD